VHFGPRLPQPVAAGADLSNRDTLDGSGPDVLPRSDGGGLVKAARRPVHGANRVARIMIGMAGRFGDRGETVPDDVWDQAAVHYEPEVLAALVVAISTINAWNRIAVTTRMIPESFRNQTG
jgi:hypothetical protein